MKKYNLGELTILDSGIEEITHAFVNEVIDQLQRYASDVDRKYFDERLTIDDKLREVERICEGFRSLASFIRSTMGIYILDAEGTAYSKKLMERMLKRKNELQDTMNEADKEAEGE